MSCLQPVSAAPKWPRYFQSISLRLLFLFIFFFLVCKIRVSSFTVLDFIIAEPEQPGMNDESILLPLRSQSQIQKSGGNDSGSAPEYS